MLILTLHNCNIITTDPFCTNRLPEDGEGRPKHVAGISYIYKLFFFYYSTIDRTNVVQVVEFHFEPVFLTACYKLYCSVTEHNFVIVRLAS